MDLSHRALPRIFFRPLNLQIDIALCSLTISASRSTRDRASEIGYGPTLCTGLLTFGPGPARESETWRVCTNQWSARLEWCHLKRWVQCGNLTITYFETFWNHDVIPILDEILPFSTENAQTFVHFWQKTPIFKVPSLPGSEIQPPDPDSLK